MAIMVVPSSVPLRALRPGQSAPPSRRSWLHDRKVLASSRSYFSIRFNLQEDSQPDFENILSDAPDDAWYSHTDIIFTN